MTKDSEHPILSISPSPLVHSKTKGTEKGVTFLGSWKHLEPSEDYSGLFVMHMQGWRHTGHEESVLTYTKVVRH
jgi:hypothetical protein